MVIEVGFGEVIFVKKKEKYMISVEIISILEKRDMMMFIGFLPQKPSVVDATHFLP